jgi:hypothetical protein
MERTLHYESRAATGDVQVGGTMNARKIVLLLGACLVLAGCGQRRPAVTYAPPTPAKSVITASSPEIQPYLQEARSVQAPADIRLVQDAVIGSIKEKVKDPDSARFKFGPLQRGAIYDSPSLNMSGLFMCGYVNSKNSFGGYAGDTRFFAHLLPLNLPSSQKAIWTAVIEMDEADLPYATHLCDLIISAS